MASAVILIVGTTGLMAIWSAPNNWDPMTYHLSRVMHWGQNRSVAHYPTHELRQLYQNPWTEFAILHLQVLTGSDRLANMVQWFSLVGYILGVTLIAKQVGSNLYGQVLAALITATIPIGILEAITTQNDYVVSFWLVCFVSFGLEIRQRWHWLYILGTAGSLELAILTKGTAYLFATPFLIWVGLIIYRSRRWSAWQPFLVIGLVVVGLNSGHYYRNLQLFDSPLQPQSLGSFDYANQTFTPSAFVSNLMRNVAIHINSPVPIFAVEAEKNIRRLHRYLNIDINDPRTTWAGTPFQIEPFQVSEDSSGNFVYLVLIYVALGSIIIEAKLLRPLNLTSYYATALTTAFLLFVFYLKWQPWHSRLHLPLFVLWSPVIGVLLSQWTYRPGTNLIALLLIIQAIPFLLANPAHPLFGPKNIFNQSRDDQYFLTNPILQKPYQTAAQLITQRQCRRVGLILPIDFWEYPIWPLLQSPEPVQIEAMNVKNETEVLQLPNFEPCAIICVGCPKIDQTLFNQKFGPPALTDNSNMLFIKP